MPAAKSNSPTVDEDSPTVDSSATTVKLPIDEDNISDITDSPVRKVKATSKQIAKEAEKQRVSKRSESKKVTKGPSAIDKDVVPNEEVVYLCIRKLNKTYHKRWQSRNKETLTKSKYKEKFNLSH